jgi:transposase
MSGNGSKRYPAELKQRAIRMYVEVRPDHDTDWAAMCKVSGLLGIGVPETLRKWIRQAEIDQGERPGVTSEESAEIKQLRRENAELRRANGILKAASAFFAAELDRPGQ